MTAFSGETSAETSELHRVYHKQRGTYGRWDMAGMVGTQGSRAGPGRSPSGAVIDPKVAKQFDGAATYDAGILQRQRDQTADLKSAGRRRALKRMTQSGGGA